MGSDICPDRLSDRVAIVTGSTAGIGLGIASRFAREGGTVIINDNGMHDGPAIAEQVKEESGNTEVKFTEADVRNPDDVQDLIEETVDAFGRIDVLVNNVGEGRYSHPTDLSLDDWAFVMESTLRSSWLTAKHAIEHMPERASIINISSAHAHTTTPGYFPYNVAKSGINGLTRALAIELSDLKIRVNAISPGAILNEIQEPDPEQLQQSPPTDPIGRLGTAADIAGLAAYLASDDASYITGSIFRADGGRLAVQQTTPDGR